MLRGFGLRVTEKGTKSFVVQYRAGYGRSAPSRRMTIGKFGASHWTVDTARKRAREILGQAAMGNDPLKASQDHAASPTVDELAKTYFEEGCEHKKPLTVRYDKSRYAGHIGPMIGRIRIDELTRQDVERLKRAIADGKTAKLPGAGGTKCTGGKTASTRTIGLLQGMLSFAVERGVVSVNVAKGIKRYPDKKRDRYLSTVEVQSLGESLRLHRELGTNSMALDIIELLLLTGSRRSEIASLKWQMIDFERSMINLPDSKSGKRSFPVNGSAMTILARQKRYSVWVFPAAHGESHYQGLGKIWEKVRQTACLDDVRLHDLRHTFASYGASMGHNLPIVGSLLGHSQPSTTARYAHLFDDPVRDASSVIGGRLSSLLSDSGQKRQTDEAA
jgi:integrase